MFHITQCQTSDMVCNNLEASAFRNHNDGDIRDKLTKSRLIQSVLRKEEFS